VATAVVVVPIGVPPASSSAFETDCSAALAIASANSFCRSAPLMVIAPALAVPVREQVGPSSDVQAYLSPKRVSSCQLASHNTEHANEEKAESLFQSRWQLTTIVGGSGALRSTQNDDGLTRCGTDRDGCLHSSDGQKQEQGKSWPGLLWVPSHLLKHRQTHSVERREQQDRTSARTRHFRDPTSASKRKSVHMRVIVGSRVFLFW
jgi:hypothetical protein